MGGHGEGMQLECIQADTGPGADIGDAQATAVAFLIHIYLNAAIFIGDYHPPPLASFCVISMLPPFTNDGSAMKYLPRLSIPFSFRRPAVGRPWGCSNKKRSPWRVFMAGTQRRGVENIWVCGSQVI
jgi:hypothetical protein